MLMLSDVTPPQRRPKPKRIEPLEKPEALPLHEQAKAEDPSFKTPEEVAVEELMGPPPEDAKSDDQDGKSKDTSAKKGRFNIKHLIPKTKKQKIIYSLVAIFLAFGVGAGWTLTHQKRAVVASPTKPKVVKKVPPPVYYSNLSGLQIADPNLNKKPVTGVMIENSIDARPQSGLSEAGVVFEAVAEGGVTRFLALFQDASPDNIGPIRSARPYYVQWALGFDAAYAHVGGSPDALNDISAWGVKDMNQFSNGGFYHRTSDRAAPHNVYTAVATLNQLEANKGYTSTFTGFTRKKDQLYKAPTPATNGKPATNNDARTPANSIDFGLSGYTYDPHYDYNASTNSYDRSEAGQPHVDANGSKRISPKVVVALVVPLSQGALDSSGAYYSNYNVLGSGTAYVFQDGTVTTAQWNKANNNSSLSFTTVDGKPFDLNRGQTWISAVTGTNKVTYK